MVQVQANNGGVWMGAQDVPQRKSEDAEGRLYVWFVDAAHKRDKKLFVARKTARIIGIIPCRVVQLIFGVDRRHDEIKTMAVVTVAKECVQYHPPRFVKPAPRVHAGLQRRRDDEVAARAVPALQEVRIVPEEPVRTSTVESFSPTPEWIAIRQRVLARGVEHPVVSHKDGVRLFRVGSHETPAAPQRHVQPVRHVLVVVSIGPELLGVCHGV